MPSEMTIDSEPPRSLGPDFTRQFARAMFRIGRECNRFDRAERIQAECDRLARLSDATRLEALSHE